MVHIKEPLLLIACSSIRDRKKKGEGVQGSTSSPTGIGSRQRMFEMLRNLECPIGLSQKKNMCAFQ